MRFFQFLFTLLFLFIVQELYSITISIIDTTGNSISYVSIQSETQSLVSDINGNAIIKESSTDEIFVFSRIGYSSKRLSYYELVENSIIMLKAEPVIQEDFLVKAEAITSPFRVSTASQKIIISDINRDFSSLSEILNEIPNVTIVGTRLMGERQTVSLGGHNSRHTIIMLDNIVLNPTGQAVDLSNIAISDIEYIEIIKNNVSVESGSGGIGGMIILHTRKNNRQNQMYLLNSIGSFNSFRQNIGVQYFHGKLGINIRSAMQSSANNFDYEYRGMKEERKHNNKSQISFSSDFVYQTNTQEVKYSLGLLDFHNQVPGTINQEQLFLRAYQFGRTTNHNLLYSKVFNDASLEAQSYFIDTKSTYNNTQTPFMIYHGIEVNEQQIKGIKIAGIKNLIWGNLNAGGQHNIESYNQTELISSSLFASQSLFKDFMYYSPELILSYRFDASNTFSNNNSWRIEYNQYFFTFIPFWVKANLGTSYMNPSFYELYYKGDSQTQGNPDLQPEKSFGYRIESELNTNPSIGLAYWHNKTDDLIYWNRSVLGWKPFNMYSAEITNYEILSSYKLFNQSIQLSYNRIDARNKTEELFNKYIPFTPSYYLDIKLKLKLYKFSQIINYYSQGEQWSTRDQLIPPLSGYNLWNSETSFDFLVKENSCFIKLFVNNVFDKKYINYPNQPEPGRNWEIQFGVISRR